MPRWVRAAGVGDLPPGAGRPVVVEGRAIALFNDAGDILAVDDTCPHQGASLGEGLLHRGEVVCPWHAWTFDLRSGESTRIPGTSVACYATRLSGGDVEVEIP